MELYNRSDPVASLSPEGCELKPSSMIRERGKQERRNAILRTAEAFIRRTGSIEFSLNGLAEESVVSVGTIYNLIGAKATVIYALLNRSLDEMSEMMVPSTTTSSPIELALLASDLAASVFEEDPVLLRPLYRFVLGAYEPEHRLAFMDRALAFWKSKLSALEEANLLIPELTLDDLAREHQIYFAGLLDQWVQGEIADDQIRVHARYSASMRLMVLADEKSREWLRGQMRAAKKSMRKIKAVSSR
ncbi:MAG: TetR/AcrR family transcriptional regulator [Thermomicrobiales bacterium]